MRRLTLVACLTALGVAFAAWAEPVAWGQRGRRGGDQRGAATLDQEQILENFPDIVELIWTDDEEDEWDDLDSDEERQAFITEFWARRDPTPGTEQNEFKEIYMGRVEAAYRQFRGEGTEGYATDRGQFFLIYGGNAVVAQRERTVSASSQSTTDIGGGGGGMGVGGGPGRATGEATAYVWEINTDINPHLEGKDEVIFVPYNRTYSMTTGGIKLDEEAFRANTDVQTCFNDPASCNLAGGGARGAGGQPGAAAGGGGAAAPATPDAVAMQELLNQGVTRNDLALDQGLRFFPAPENNTYTVMAFEVGKDGLSLDGDEASLTAFGALMKVEEQGEQVIREMRMPFTVSADEGTESESATHSFGMTLVPGNYRLAWGVMDDASEAITTVDRSFEVPDFGTSGLTLTSVLVSRGQPAEEDEAIDINTVYEGVRVGSIAADVDIDHTFARDDTMMLLYFVMGAQVDQAQGQVALEVEHRVLDTEGNGVARLPVQTLNYFVIGQQIPLGQIDALQPGTDYIVRIRVKDTTTGQEITEDVPFHVAGETG